MNGMGRVREKIRSSTQITGVFTMPSKTTTWGLVPSFGEFRVSTHGRDWNEHIKTRLKFVRD